TATGAGGDPYARALTQNPYNVLPGLGPDDDMTRVLRLMQVLQRRKLQPEQDAALRTVRALSARLAWDLLTLGTTPGVTPGQWQATRALLRDRRAAAHQLWGGDQAGPPGEPPALHVRAVLCANEVCWQARTAGGAEDSSLRAFVARWAALLARREWLALFA